MDSDSWAGLGLLLGAVVLLVAAVGAEAWLAIITSVRLRGMASKGVTSASILLRYLQDRQATLAAIALARSLGLVGVTAITVFLVLDNYGVRWSALVVAFAGILVISGLVQAVPRLLVFLNPEVWVGMMASIIRLLRLAFRWPVWALDLPFRLLARWRGLAPVKEQTDVEEFLRLVEEGTAGDEHKVEREMIRRIVDLEETTAREIMVPRIDVVAVEMGTPLEQVVRVIMERGFSRIPLYEETIDNIVGVIYAKDILGHLLNGRRPLNLREIARPPYFIPEGKKVDELLAEMRLARVHMAIVVDEYGGTAGLVTIEDLLEEIVGEIADEFEMAEEAPIEKLTDTEAILDARVSIDALNELFGLEVESDDFHTVGGFVYHQLGKMPSVGDEVRVDGLTLRVLSVLGHRIKKVRVTKELQPASGEPTAK
ncbi:MAG: hemolysin family protein [Dehalococcoidia bacterium]